MATDGHLDIYHAAVHMMDKLEKIIHLAWEENPLGVQKLRVGAVAGTY